MSASALGARGGDLDLLWFPRLPNVCQRLCHTLFTQYVLQFFTNDFHIFIYSDHGQDLELIHLSWLWLNCKGHRDHYVSKLTLFRRYFLQFCADGFKLRHLVSMDKTFNWLTFRDLVTMFQVTGGCYLSKLFILLRNSKTIEDRTFAWSTLLGYLLV